MRWLIALVLPPLTMLVRGRLVAALVCAVLMITLLGWPIASIWALAVAGGSAGAVPRGNAGYWVDVVGESNYQRALARITGGRTPDGVNIDTTATLIPEPSNPYDPNAVRVDIAGQTVGYLDRSAAVTYRQRGGKRSQCRATINGGWDRGDGDAGHFGVRVQLP